MNILLTALFGGIFASDSTAALQIMISRPIFCAPIIGFILGDIEIGLQIGMIIELLWIAVVPLGNSVPPDATVVASSCVYIATLYNGDYMQGYILFLVLSLIPVGILFKRIDMIHRSFNSRFSYIMEQKINEGDIDYVDKITYFSWFLFILKASVFIAIVVSIGSQILPWLYAHFSNKLMSSFQEAFYIVPAVGLGTAITTFLFKKSQMAGK